MRLPSLVILILTLSVVPNTQIIYILYCTSLQALNTESSTTRGTPFSLSGKFQRPPLLCAETDPTNATLSMSTVAW